MAPHSLVHDTSTSHVQVPRQPTVLQPHAPPSEGQVAPPVHVSPPVRQHCVEGSMQVLPQRDLPVAQPACRAAGKHECVRGGC